MRSQLHTYCHKPMRRHSWRKPDNVLLQNRISVLGITTTLDAVSKRPHSSLCIFYTSPPPFPFFYLSSSTPPPPPITPSPRWLWGRPVGNAIGIIPFSLIASAGEQPYVSHRAPTEPLTAYYTHVSHRNLLKAESEHVCAQACVLMQGSREPHALQCKVPLQFFVCFFLIYKCSKTGKKTDLFCLSNTCWWRSAPSVHQCRRDSQTIMLKEGGYSKWPNGKTKGLICASALGELWSNGCREMMLL